MFSLLTIPAAEKQRKVMLLVIAHVRIYLCRQYYATGIAPRRDAKGFVYVSKNRFFPKRLSLAFYYIYISGNSNSKLSSVSLP